MDIRTAHDKQAVLEALLNDARIEANHLRAKLEAYRRLIASTRLVMGHEIKRPTAAIAGYLEVAREDVEQAGLDHALSFLDKARAECDLLNELNTFYLELLRSDPADETPRANVVDVYDLIVEAADQLPDSLNAGTRVLVVRSEELPALPVNRNALKIILVNLLENALRYSPRESSVRVEATVGRDQRGVDGRDLLKLRVVDTGSGMSADDVKRIFQPFVRLDGGAVDGAGLGLTLVRSLVDMCGGSVTVRSAEGAGTTFFVTLPLIAPGEDGGLLG